MSSTTFSTISGSVKIEVTLTEASGGVFFEVRLVDAVTDQLLTSSDLTGVFFDINGSLSSVNFVSNPGDPDSNDADGIFDDNDVFQFVKGENSIVSVQSSTGNITMSGANGLGSILFDAAVGLQKPGSGFLNETSFFISGVNLNSFVGSRFGFRVGSGGTAEPKIITTFNPPTVSISFQANSPDLFTTVDLTGDGQNDISFRPELDGSFYQVVTVANTSTTTSTTATQIAINASSNIFDIDFNTPGNPTFALLDDGDNNPETALIEIASLAPGATIELKFLTTVQADDPQTSTIEGITTRELTFTTAAGSDPDDPGSSFNALTLYLNLEEYTSNQSNGEFKFGAFGAYTPTAGLTFGSAATATLLPLTLYGKSFTTQGGVHTLYSTDDHVFNSDTLYSATGTRRSTPAPFSLQLLWASDDPAPDPNNVYDALDYIDSATFDVTNSTPIFKGMTGFFNVGGPQGFSQTALAGNFSESDLIEITFSGGSFQAFVDGISDKTKQYRVLVSGTSTIDWNRYSGEYIREVVFLSASTGGTATVNNITVGDTLDLSNVLFLYNAGSSANLSNRIFVPLNALKVTGDRGNNTQVDIVIGSLGKDEIIGSTGRDNLNGGQGDDIINGGGGSDVIRGGFGNDTLTGGGAIDTFVLAKGEGSDTVTDFRSNGSGKDIIGLANGLKFSDLRFSGSNIILNSTSEVLTTLTGFNAATLISSDFVSI